MRPRSSPSTVPKFLKASLIVIVLVLVGLVGYGVYLYQTIETNKVAGYHETEERIISETAITEVNTIERFHGNTFYHVVTGTTADDVAIIAYVDVENESEDITFFLLEDLVDQETIINEWQANTDVDELLTAQYGIRGSIPLLEFIYIDGSDRLSYDYYRLEDGSYDSGISFSNDFK